ncbi:hypothetical protein ACVW18_005173 [Bacillus thuringiensis]
MNQDPILQKAMNKWERMSQDSSFRQAYEAKEKVSWMRPLNSLIQRNKGLQIYLLKKYKKIYNDKKRFK